SWFAIVDSRELRLSWFHEAEHTGPDQQQRLDTRAAVHHQATRGSWLIAFRCWGWRRGQFVIVIGLEFPLGFADLAVIDASLGRTTQHYRRNQGEQQGSKRPSHGRPPVIWVQYRCAQVDIERLLCQGGQIEKWSESCNRWKTSASSA